jgi:endoglucanase
MKKANYARQSTAGGQGAALPPLCRGVNLGNFLECRTEGDATGGLLIQDGWFSLLKEAGFDFVRIPVRWSAHGGSVPPFAVDGAFMERVAHVVDAALSSGLSAIVNQHHFEELMAEPEAQEQRFIGIWKQAGLRFRGYPDALIFEVLNEPCGRLTSQLWNRLWPEAYGALRSVEPSRLLALGPADWNNVTGFDEFTLSAIADDPRVVATFHYYEPHPFTHQGARWVKPPHPMGARWTGTAGQVAAVRRDLDRAAEWGSKEGRFLFMGEFGAYQKHSAWEEILSWTRCVREEAEKRGMAWCLWEFCHDFGVWDRKTRTFKEPLLRALIP